MIMKRTSSVALLRMKTATHQGGYSIKLLDLFCDVDEEDGKDWHVPRRDHAVVVINKIAHDSTTI